MSDSGRAVFLSYASQDADVAKRIAEALRAAGVEVWFDQSELRGGDAWDGMIRKRIKECVLFVPIITPNTNSRAEGYFRLEWKLAVDRSHLMADDAPFLFPIVIGEVTDASARVPDKFREVQWTRLRLDETPGELAGRVARLLSGNVGRDFQIPPPSGKAGFGDPALQKSARWSWWMIFPVLGTIMGLMFAAVPLWKAIQGPPPKRQTQTPDPKLQSQTLSEARQLAAKAQPLHENMGGATRADFDLAGEMFKRALELAPLDAEVWAHYSWFCNNIYGIGVDRTPEREAEIKRSADRAFKLDPTSPMARFAWANYYRRQPAANEEAIRVLRELVRQHPDNKVMLRVLANALRFQPGKSEEALALLDQAIALPGGDAHAWTVKGDTLNLLGRAAEAEAAYEQSLVIKRAPRVLIRRAIFLMTRHGDLTGAERLLAQVPGEFMQEDRAVSVAGQLALWQRKPALCLKVLAAFPRDYIEDGNYAYLSGSKAGMTGLARWQEGKPDLARVEWVEGLRVVEQRLANRRTDEALLREKVFLLAALGRRPEAEAAAKLMGQLNSDYAGWGRALIDAWTGEKARALQFLAGQPVIPQMRYGPHWEPLRDDPRFQKLLADSEAAQRAALPPRDWPKDRELKRAIELIEGLESIPDDFALAEQIVKPIVDRAPTDIEAVTVMARLQAQFMRRGFDRTDERAALAKRYAERALQLAPDEPEAMYALATYHFSRATGETARTEQLLRRAMELDPSSPRPGRLLADLYNVTNRPAEAITQGQDNIRRFPNDVLSHYDLARSYKDQGRYDEFDRELDATLALAPLPNAIVWKARLQFGLRNDFAGMKTWLDKVPARVRGTERAVFGYFLYAAFGSDAEAGLAALRDFPQKWFTDFEYAGPTALLNASLLELQGKKELARRQYEVAQGEIQRMRQTDPGRIGLSQVEFWTLLGLGRTEEAQASHRRLVEGSRRPYVQDMVNGWWFTAIPGALLIGDRATALTFLRESVETRPESRAAFRLRFQIDPRMAPWRDDPEIKALLAGPEAGKK